VRTESNKVKVVLNLRKDQHEALQKHSETTGIPMSRTIRDIIDGFLYRAKLRGRVRAAK
jgi:hypothetical protein